MRVLRHHDVVAVLQSLTPNECRTLLTILTNTLCTLSTSSNQPSIHQPVRENITTSLGHTTLFMPASNTKNVGIKTITLPNGGPTAGATSIFSATGELLGLLNAEELTAFRTALASMIIFTRRDWVERGDDVDSAESRISGRVCNVVIFGAGKQAEWHLRLALILGPSTGEIGHVTVVNRSRDRLESFDRNVLSSLREQYQAVHFATLAKEGISRQEYETRLRQTLNDNCAAIFCCTPATEPLFPAEYLADPAGGGMPLYISLIGSYKPHMQEVDTATVLSGKLLCVDSKEACLKQAGELIIGEVQAEQLTEIGELIAALEKTARSGPGSGGRDSRLESVRKAPVVTKLVGLGIMDIVIGKEILDWAERKGLGTVIEDF